METNSPETDYDDEYLDSLADNLTAGEVETTTSRQPPDMDFSTFKLRNDPKPLLDRFRLQLMKAYVVEEQIVDESGVIKTVKKIKFKKGVKPTANKNGVDEIINYLEKVINNHTVMGNIDTAAEFNKIMLGVADDIVITFTSKREDWGVDVQDLDWLIASAQHLVHLFLTRLKYDKERESYSKGFQETTHKTIGGQGGKPSVIQKMGSFISKKLGGERV